MAFTDEQKTRIRFFLGYPFPFQYLNPRLESAMELVGADVTASGMVLQLVSKLLAFYGLDPLAVDPPIIDKAIVQAGVQRVESVNDVIQLGTTNAAASGGTSSAILNAQNDAARQMVGALSALLGVEIASDVFGKNGYVAGGWAERANWMSRGPKSVLMGTG
jgi:hypothetical protein